MQSFGKYILFIYSLIINRERFMVYVRLIVDECLIIGVKSVPIVSLISTFIGAVSAVQTSFNLVSPLIPRYMIGLIVRDMILTELAPTLTCLVLAGKVGSHMAGQLGSMRIKEQIDALEVMGINSASYLVLPKVIASLFMFPMLVVLAGFLALTGGYLAATLTGIMTEVEYIKGLRTDFNSFSVMFALIRTWVFAFLIASVSSFKGFYTRGGALEVGQSSTRAVTSAAISVLCADYLLTQLVLG